MTGLKGSPAVVAAELSSVVIGGHKTSVSLEDEFCDWIKEIAAELGRRLPELINAVDEARNRANLSSARRIFTLDYYKRIRPSPCWQPQSS
jgi:predicted DNA-binding ribbon-helix-helix protein